MSDRYLNFRGVGYSESLTDWRKSYLDPADVRAVMDANRPKLFTAIQAVAAVTSSLDLTTTPQGKSDKPATDRKVSA